MDASELQEVFLSMHAAPSRTLVQTQVKAPLAVARRSHGTSQIHAAPGQPGREGLGWYPL